MNAFQPPQQSVWREASDKDGRKYYYNTQTKATQWTKPEDLMSSAERALLQSTWKEYTHTDGRKYWHNVETNVTTWTMPDVVKNAQQPQTPSLPSKPPASNFVSGGMQYQESHQPRRDDHFQIERSSGYNSMEGVRSTAMNTQTDHEYSTQEEAESAFFKLLRRTGVQPEWTWAQTMKAAIKDSAWRSIKDPKDRRAAFDKFVAEVRAQEKDRERDRQAKLRADFYTMLRSHPEIKYYTRWRTAMDIIEGETIFKSARTEEEAQALFNEYRADLYKSHIESESELRKTALDRLSQLFQSLNLEPYTRWSEAQQVLKKDGRVQGDDTFKPLSKIDVLKAFENHIKSLERTFNDKRQKQKALKTRKERQNRDQYKELLKDLKAGGKLKAGTKWAEILDLIEDDPRYVAMLGQSGSTPVDLFLDEIDAEEEKLRGKRHEVMDVLEDRRFEITPKTTFEEFAAILKTDSRTGILDASTTRSIFEKLREKVLRRSDEDRHYQRRTIDALRSRIRRLEPPVGIHDTWEQVRPRVERTEEFRALDSEDLRHQAFDRVIRRLKEQREEDDRDRESHRSHRDRERDRDSRRSGPGSGETHRRHRTRTPEIDAYAADRKKAQADRERQYRRGSFGVSPPPGSDGSRRGTRERERERDRDDRYEPPPRGVDRYDGRNRRGDERERDRVDRERGYVSRADPRDHTGGELDYGEGGAPLSAGSVSGSRRRRDSDSDGGRDTKRLRASISKSPTSATETKDPDVAYKSGSEEGEIEEE